MAADELRVAAGCVDITPARPIALAGFTSRASEFRVVSDRLEMSAVLFLQREVSVLLVSLDALYVGRGLEEAFRDALAANGYSDCGLIVGATHTHFAPNVDSSKPLLGAVDEAHCRYVETAAGALVAALCAREPQPARLWYGSSTASHSVNRRRSRRGAIVMRENPDGPTDETVHVVRIDAGNESLILWSYACHPVGSPDPLAVTADFPGVVRGRLRASYGANFPVLYFQGFSADVRPRAVIRPGRRPLRRLEAHRYGRELGHFLPEDYRRWSSSLAEVVAAVSPQLFEANLGFGAVDIAVDRLVDGDTGVDEIRVSRLRLGPKLQLIAVGAEVAVEYTRLLREMFRTVETMTVGCAGPTFGYIPTDAMVAEGGYEAGGFFEEFGIPGASFRTAIAKIIAAAVRAATA